MCAFFCLIDIYQFILAVWYYYCFGWNKFNVIHHPFSGTNYKNIILKLSFFCRISFPRESMPPKIKILLLKSGQSHVSSFILFLIYNVPFTNTDITIHCVSFVIFTFFLVAGLSHSRCRYTNLDNYLCSSTISFVNNTILLHKLNYLGPLNYWPLIDLSVSGLDPAKINSPTHCDLVMGPR